MEKPETFRLLLVKAGETEWDRSGRLTGTADLPLAAGVRDTISAEISGWQAAGGSGECKPATLITAPDEASVETASMLGKVLCSKPRRARDLADQDLGLWEGVLESEFAGRCRTLYRAMQDDPASVTPPSGEPWSAFEPRVFSAIQRAASKLRGDVALAVVLRTRAHRAVLDLLNSAQAEQIADGTLPSDGMGLSLRMFDVRSGLFARAIRAYRATA